MFKKLIISSTLAATMCMSTACTSVEHNNRQQNKLQPQYPNNMKVEVSDEEQRQEVAMWLYCHYLFKVDGDDSSALGYYNRAVDASKGLDYDPSRFNKMLATLPIIHKTAVYDARLAGYSEGMVMQHFMDLCEHYGEKSYE